jgi:hypothetical protein
MTSVALAESRLSSKVAPPAPPTSIEETGLHPDTLAQLMLKTLVAGEASGTGLSEKLRVPYSVLDALIQHARIEKLVEVRGTSGAGSAGYRYILLVRAIQSCESSLTWPMNARDQLVIVRDEKWVTM